MAFLQLTVEDGRYILIRADAIVTVEQIGPDCESDPCLVGYSLGAHTVTVRVNEPMAEVMAAIRRAASSSAGGRVVDGIFDFGGGAK